MIELAAAAIGALIVGALVGGFFGFMIADRRLRRLYEEVRAETVRMRAIAKEKLSSEEPDLDTLLRGLNDAVQDTFKAAAALENHEKVVARQHEGGMEVIASSRHIIRMIDELAGNEPEPAEPIEARSAPVLTADEPDDGEPRARRR